MTADPAADPNPAPDPGLGRERTALAWQRTSLSLLLASAVLLRLRFTGGQRGAALGPAVALVLAGWVLVESRLRYRATADGGRVRPGRSGRSGLALAAATGILALTEILVVTRS